MLTLALSQSVILIKQVNYEIYAVTSSLSCRELGFLSHDTKEVQFSPTISDGFLSDLMLGTIDTFWDRVRNHLFYIYVKLFEIPNIYNAQEALAKKYFGSDCPSVEHMVRNRTLLLSSSSWLFEHSRPVFPNTIHVGPLHIEGLERKPLPQVKSIICLIWFQNHNNKLNFENVTSRWLLILQNLVGVKVA